MTDTIIAAFIGALGMLVWIVLAAFLYDHFMQEINK